MHKVSKPHSDRSTKSLLILQVDKNLNKRINRNYFRGAKLGTQISSFYHFYAKRLKKSIGQSQQDFNVGGLVNPEF